MTAAMKSLASSAQTRASKHYRQVRKDAAATASDLRDQGMAAFEGAHGAVTDSLTSLEDSLEDAVRQRPLSAVGLAIGLGFLIGVTWRR